MAVTIVFETHAISTDNEQGIATGWLPGSLSETGLRLAQELGARRRNDNITAVITSDLRRAVETAEIAFQGTGIPIQKDARLRECNYGSMNGMPVDQLAAERSRHIDEPWPTGESYRQVVARMQSFLADVAARFDRRRILVIGHSATRWSLDHLINDNPLEDLVDAPFDWQPGWDYVLIRPASWPRS